MDEKCFLLHHRYEVRPTTNGITDTLQQKEIKLEPRLMKLLCILAKQRGQLVKRENLVTEIWNDYGGAEAGLNHAVSTLRKLLNDTSKQLIETVPTKGYILHALVNELETAAGTMAPETKKFSKRPVLYGLVILVAAITLYFFLQFPTANRDELGSLPPKDMSIPYDKVNKKIEENSLNTIITIGDDSTVYKLKVVGGSRPEFYVNQRLLSPDEMEKHLDLINNLKKQLKERSR